MNHSILLKEAESYEFSHQIACSFGGGESKVLRAVVKNGSVKYEVLNFKEPVLITSCLDEAVNKYNNI